MSNRTGNLLSLVTKSKELGDRILDLSVYESTKSTSKYEREKAVEGWKKLEKELKAKENKILIEQPTLVSNILNDFELLTPHFESLKSSDSEYIPSSCSDSGTEKSAETTNSIFSKSKCKSSKIPPSAKDSSSELHKNKIRNKFKLITAKKSIISSSSKHGKDNIKKKAKLMTSSDTNSSEEEEINVQAVKNRNGKRMRNKDHSCYFCHKLIINLARHLEVMHENEPTVAKILAMPKSSEQRRTAFANILRAGDFYHNCEVLATKKGELILARRPTEAESKVNNYSSYGPCPDCLGFMLKKHLWNHMKFRCTKKNVLNKIEDKNKRYPIAESTALMNRILGSDFSKEYFSSIVTKLRSDDIGYICRNDKLIMNFGAMLFEKYNITQEELIRQYMRQIGRLLIELKSNDKSVKNLAQCLIPEKFDDIVKATKNICPARTQLEKKSSLAFKIGYALKNCVSIERAIALRNEDLKKNETLMSFLNLIETEWQIRISAMLHKGKINSTDLLPLTSDLIKLSKYLEEEMKRLQDEVKRNFDKQSWSSLVTFTLSRIILFNKRRSVEPDKLTVEEYTTRPIEALKKSLLKFELHLASKLRIVETEGKRERKLPILLTKDMTASIDLIIKTRIEAGVESKNQFVFAELNSLGPVKGHDCLRKVCEEADLECSNFITGTKLGEYIATVYQVLNLTESEIDWLSKYLGIKVHKEFYKNQESTEITKVTRLLLAVDKGEVNQFSGKKLNEIDISDLPAYEEESNAGENDDLVEEESDHNDEEEDLNGQNKIIDKAACSKNTTDSEIPKTCSKKPGKSSRRKGTKKTWSTEECEAVQKFFKSNIKHERIPRKEECDKCLKNNEILANRKWSDVKFYVKNYICKIRRNKKN